VVDSHVLRTPPTENLSQILDSDDLTSTDVDLPFSYVDIAAGRTNGNFAACHRYEVHRRWDHEDKTVTTDQAKQEDEDSADATQVVQIINSDFSSNPSKDEPGMLGWMHSLHLIYARWLHSDGVREVLRI